MAVRRPSRAASRYSFSPDIDVERREDLFAFDTTVTIGRVIVGNLFSKRRCTKLPRPCPPIRGKHGFSTRPSRSGLVVTRSYPAHIPRQIFGTDVGFDRNVTRYTIQESKVHLSMSEFIGTSIGTESTPFKVQSVSRSYMRIVISEL
jgi:hypothetical protein